MAKPITWLPLLVASGVLNASEVQIVSAEAECAPRNQCVFRVRLKHADSGWDHYANGWQVMDEKGHVLVERILHHPHVREQPFTRSSNRTGIAANIRQVYIRAGDNVNGLNSKVYKLKLP